MNQSISDFVNEAPSSNSIGSIDMYLSDASLPSPIDAYVQYTRSLLRFGTPDHLNQNEHLGGLLLLGAVSAAEAYFRSIFSQILEMCPISREVAADKQINLGGVLWHGYSEFRRSAFEHVTFCSREDIKKHARAYISFELRDSHFKDPLAEFDRVCHLRHGLVHNGGILPGRNAVQVGAKPSKAPKRIDLDFGSLQSLIAAIDTLVLTFNRELFHEMCRRWATAWRQRSDWDGANAEKIFNSIWKLHFCKELHSQRLGRGNITRGACLSQVKVEYDL
ncbi:MAG: hypothetical protein PHX82_04710 [Paracoccaceae bacterium]|nr:hypothetical protein [Paracoccaceae bacterium]